MRPTPERPILVLFDIDGTLLDTHGAGRDAFIRALQVVFGWEDDLHYIHFSGSTDLDVFNRIMERRGVPVTPDDTYRFFQQLPRELRQTILPIRPTVFPGIRELLDLLAGDPRVRVGLVTGNVESCARIKLRHADIDGHFELGAFGHEHAGRTDIARLAIERARAHLAPGTEFSTIYLIGDTPSDIQAARQVGAVSIAVATGVHRLEHLLEQGADHAFADLADLTRMRNILRLDAELP